MENSQKSAKIKSGLRGTGQAVLLLLFFLSGKKFMLDLKVYS